MIWISYYQNLGIKGENFPIAELYYDKAISIPLFHTMTFEQQDEVVDVLNKILQ